MARLLVPRAVVAACLALVLCALSAGAVWAQAPAPQEPPAAAEPGSGDSVTISAQKFDRHTLERELVPQFVKARSAPTPIIEQLTRWHDLVCPEVQGLPPAYGAIVSNRIFAAAQAAAAPNTGAGHACKGNITVVFSGNPQQLLDGIAKDHPSLLGSFRKSGDTTISRPVQVWYLTGTRQLNGTNNMPVYGLNSMTQQVTQRAATTNGNNSPGNVGAGGAAAISPGAPPPESTSALSPDPPYGGEVPGGQAGSRLGEGLRSEMMHALIIVDARKLKGMSLETVSDYIAFLALTRVASLDACEKLPSIVDLLSASCSGRPKPDALTDADAAFLKALYATALEGKISVEQGEVYMRMIAALREQQAAR